MHVNALNARTGEGFWKFKYTIENIDVAGVRNRAVSCRTRSDELDMGTLRIVADQAGADDFQAFLDEMDKMV